MMTCGVDLALSPSYYQQGALVNTFNGTQRSNTSIRLGGQASAQALGSAKDQQKPSRKHLEDPLQIDVGMR